MYQDCYHIEIGNKSRLAWVHPRRGVPARTDWPAITCLYKILKNLLNRPDLA